MKRLLVMVLALSMVISVICSPSVFALNEKEVTLFETDFENDTVGSAPAALAPYGNAIADNATVYAEADGNKYADTLGKGINKRFRMLFNEAVSSGVVVAEFDLNTTGGAVALGMVYKNSNTTYHKWPFYVTGESKDYTVKGFTAIGGNPPSEEVANKTVTFTKDGSSDNLTFKVNQWQHYKVIFDFDNQTVTAYIDNEKSSTIGGYEYFGKTNDAIAGLAFYCSANDTETYKPSNKFDNIKVYTGYGNYLVDVDYDDGNIGTSYISSGVNATDKYLSFNKVQGNVARYMFGEINSTNADELYVEFDVKTGFGGMGLSLWDKSETSYGSPNKFVFSAGTKNSTPARGIGVYKVANTSHPASSGKTIYTDASGNEMALSENTWQHVKVKIDLKNKQSSITVDGKTSTPVDVSYLENISIKGITVKWSLALNPTSFGNLTDAQKEAFIDNIKVYTVSDGVSSSLASGGNKIKLTFKDTVDSTSVNNIALYKADGTKVDTALPSVSDDKKTVTITSDSLTDGTKYFVLLNGVKYEDGYAVCEIRKEFTYQTGAFTVAIDDFTPSAYTPGTKIDVNYNFTVTDFSEKNVDLIIAAYNGGELTEVQITPATVNKTENKAASLTLTKDCDEITAFVWENTKLIPLAKNVTKQNKR